MSEEPARKVAKRVIEEHDLAIDAHEAALHIQLARLAGAEEEAIEAMIRQMGTIKTATDDEQAEQQGIVVHHIPDDILPDESR